MRQKRIREKFWFWLDISRDEDFEIADTISELKRERTFTQTIRDGIRLVVSLRAGRIDVLEELFPAIVERIRKDKGGGDPDGWRRIEQQIADLKLTLAAPQGMTMAAQQAGPKPLDTGPKQNFDLPTFDDDDDDLITVKKAKGSGRKANENFLAAMMRLQQQ